MRVFVLHLCVADLLVTFFQVCPQLMWDVTDRFAGPDLTCPLIKYLQVVGVFASTSMMMVMTVDRYEAICNPVVTFQRRQVCICRAVWTNLRVKTHRQSVGSMPPRASSPSGVSQARKKTVKMTVVIVAAYVACWAPFFTVQLWSVWDPNAPKETGTFTVLMLLASLNSVANPCVYLLFSKGSVHAEGTVVSSLHVSFPRDSWGKCC
ncbi:hypothetical protein GN956_G5137 [Arapaima gigas]